MYTPIGYSWKEVDSFSNMPTDKDALLNLFEKLEEKHGKDIKVENRSYTQQEYSYRSDSSYTTSVSKYSVMKLMPDYSKEDMKQMEKDNMAAIIKRINDTVALSLAKHKK